MDLSVSAIHPVRKSEVNEDQKHLFTLPEIPIDYVPVKRRDVEGVEMAFVLENVFSKTECEYLVRTAEEVGFSFWDTTRTVPRKDFRDADTIECTHLPLADLMWKRMKPFVQSQIELEQEHKYWQSDLQGNWIACSINENLLFGRYRDGGHFAPHTDGCTIIDFNHRSMFSVILYLNTCKEGGRTHIYQDEQLFNLVRTDKGFTGDIKYLIDSVDAKQGSALVFYHAIVHEGELVAPDAEKYIIRTDVMYKRETPICNQPNDIEAFQLYEKAKELTNEGKPEEAARLFRRAFKMSPTLSDIYQM
jgi:leukotriene-A4 hydrolase